MEGFENDLGYELEEIPEGTDTGIDEYGKKYAIRKKKIYQKSSRFSGKYTTIARNGTHNGDDPWMRSGNL